MLDLIIGLIGAQRESQQELTEAQLEAIRERLVRGEIHQAQAMLLLSRQAQRGDIRSVSATMEYLAALGMDGAEALRIAANFYLDRRHYGEAQRYAQTLCYEYDRYGSALRLLAILDTLRGDYVSALLHVDEYLERSAEDLEIRWFQLEALLRSGSLTAAAELNQTVGLRSDIDAFLRYRQSKGLARFSWHGQPTRSGQVFDSYDVHQIQRFMRDILKRPLQRTVPDFETLDLLINSGTYVSDRRQFGVPDLWVAPAAFEVTLVGDCEDFALWAWANLCRLGYPARFVIGGWCGEGPNHAWVTIHRGGTVEVLECTPQGFNPTIRASKAIEYRPWWSIDRNLHYYRH